MRICGIAENEEIKNCQSVADGETNVIEEYKERNKEKEKKKNFGLK